MEYLGNIDLARWVIDGDYTFVMRAQAALADCFTYENGRASYEKPSSIRESNYHDGARKTHVACFEIEGPVAGNVVESFGWTYSQYLNRLDWRVALAHEPYTYDEMYWAMKTHRHKGEGFMEMDSRVRRKRGKRDAGGESLYSGAAGSDKRLVYYKRGKERAAVECRALQKECKLLVRRAMSRWESGGCATPIDCITEQLDQYSEVLFHDRTGYSWRVVTGQEQRTETENLFTHQENLLDRIAGLAAQLDNTGKAALLDSLIETADTMLEDIDETWAFGKRYTLTDDSGLDE